jgi:hypothetical protein
MFVVYHELQHQSQTGSPSVTWDRVCWCPEATVSEAKFRKRSKNCYRAKIFARSGYAMEIEANLPHVAVIVVASCLVTAWYGNILACCSIVLGRQEVATPLADQVRGLGRVMVAGLLWL